MSATNFALLTNEQKTAWSLDFWKQARNLSFVNKFLGKDANSLIQHITELKKTEKGARAVITLLADLEGDGIVGDRTLEGNEEAMKSYDQVIRIDQMRNANRHEGRMADQKSVVDFRTNSRDKLSYWLADRIDQLAFLTLAGKAYTFNTNGTTRVGSDLKNLEFASDVTAPSAKRVGRWNNTSKQFEVGSLQNTIVAGATPDYPAWELFVALKAYAKENYVRGVMGDGGEETYHAFLSPMAMSRLKVDPVYRDNLRWSTSGKGEAGNQFTGTSVKIDGIYLHEFRHVPNTRMAASGSKWGAGSNVDGCQVLFCGAQALGMADIGNPDWVEKEFDYDNQPGISVQKILGFKKPVFSTQYSGGTAEDHGVISAYVAQ